MIEVSVVEREPRHAAVVHMEGTMADLPGFFDRAFATVMDAVQSAGLEVTGAPFGHYPRPPGETVEVNAGIPVAEAFTATGEVRALELPGGPAAVTMHVGPYDTLAQTYQELMGWLTTEGRTPAGPMWEHYLSDPTVEPDPSKWRTEIVCPLTS